MKKRYDYGDGNVTMLLSSHLYIVLGPCANSISPINAC